MKNKSKAEMRKFRAVITVEFEAESREMALASARVLVDNKEAKIRVQEATTAWMTVPDSTPSA